MGFRALRSVSPKMRNCVLGVQARARAFSFHLTIMRIATEAKPESTYREAAALKLAWTARERKACTKLTRPQGLWFRSRLHRQ